MFGRIFTAWDCTEPIRISYYHPRHTKVRRPHETHRERALRGVASDHHAYSTADTPRLTAILIVNIVPQTYLISLESCRIDQDIVQSSSAHRGQKTTRDALREGSERGHSRSSCVYHGGCLATDRYHNRAGRSSDVSVQPGIVQSRSGHHKFIVTTLRSQTVYEPCLEGSRSPLPSVLSATSS